MPALALKEGEVHLWYTLPDELVEPELLARYDRLMTEEERTRRLRFRFPEGRHEFLVTRALVRTVLSRYADVAPADWRFQIDPLGRPSVLSPPQPGLCFNLTHTYGLIACAVVRGTDVGVDAEDILRRGQTEEIADRFFAPSEVDELRALPKERRRERFFEYWTLKEAYLKARGTGLRTPLEKFAFRIEPDRIRIGFEPDLEDDPAKWQFAQLRPTPRHLVGVAVRDRADRAMSLKTWQTRPLE